MSELTSLCKHKKVDEYGICVVCGIPTRLYPFQQYATISTLLELERGRGTISESQYMERKTKLETIKDYCIKNDLWHFTMKDFIYP